MGRPGTCQLQRGELQGLARIVQRQAGGQIQRKCLRREGTGCGWQRCRQQVQKLGAARAARGAGESKRRLGGPRDQGRCHLPHCSLVVVCSPSHQPRTEKKCPGHTGSSMHEASIRIAQNFVWPSKLVVVLGNMSLSHRKTGRVAQRVRRE